MCIPGCMEMVAQTISRRGVFKAGAGLTAALGAASLLQPGPARAAMSFSKVVDLTHVLKPGFPTYFGKPQLEIEVLNDFAKDGFNIRKWHLVEHTGTHLDAPLHFTADKQSADQIPVASLVVPLCVVNIAERAAGDADTQVTPDDIKAWETKNGALPEGACVTMNSGWDAHVATDKFRNANEAGMHFPGFHPEATALLLERNVSGIAVDTLSLDYGQSKDFKTHYMWLPANRWGLECVANLSQVPESGATIVVGGPTVEGASGGPSRVLALV